MTADSSGTVQITSQFTPSYSLHRPDLPHRNTKTSLLQNIKAPCLQVKRCINLWRTVWSWGTGKIAGISAISSVIRKYSNNCWNSRILKIEGRNLRAWCIEATISMIFASNWGEKVRINRKSLTTIRLPVHSRKIPFSNIFQTLKTAHFCVSSNICRCGWIQQSKYGRFCACAGYNIFTPFEIGRKVGVGEQFWIHSTSLFLIPYYHFYVQLFGSSGWRPQIPFPRLRSLTPFAGLISL